VLPAPLAVGLMALGLVALVLLVEWPRLRPRVLA
jgi:hypothetical protein